MNNNIDITTEEITDALRDIMKIPPEETGRADKLVAATILDTRLAKPMLLALQMATGLSREEVACCMATGIRLYHHILKVRAQGALEGESRFIPR